MRSINGTGYNSKSTVMRVLFIFMAFIICLQIAYNVVDYIRMARTSSYVMYDFKLRWQECAYVLNGINPFDSISGDTIIPSIGKIDSVAGTMPWAYMLGNVMVAGWLDYEAAQTYYNVFYVLSGIICFLLIINEYKKIQSERKWGTLAVCSFFGFWALVYAYLLGNYGTTCCFLGIISILLPKKGKAGKIGAGILLAVSLCKPQIGGMLLLTYLLYGEFLIVGISVVTVIISYLAVAMLTNTGIIVLIRQIMEQGTAYIDVLVNDGIFTILRNFGIPTIIILFLSLCAGIAVFAYCFVKVKNSGKENGIENIFYLFTPASLCSCVWFYHNPYDTMILIVPILTLSLLLVNQRSIKEIFFLVACWIMLMSGYLICERYGVVFLRRIGFGDYLAHDAAILIEDLAYIIICLKMTHLIVKESVLVKKI